VVKTPDRAAGCNQPRQVDRLGQMRTHPRTCLLFCISLHGLRLAPNSGGPAGREHPSVASVLPGPSIMPDNRPHRVKPRATSYGSPPWPVLACILVISAFAHPTLAGCFPAIPGS